MQYIWLMQNETIILTQHMAIIIIDCRTLIDLIYDVFIGGDDRFDSLMGYIFFKEIMNFVTNMGLHHSNGLNSFLTHLRQYNYMIDDWLKVKASGY